MLNDGELDSVGEYDSFSEDSETEQDAWHYLECYCYETDYENAGEEIAYMQGYLKGISHVVNKFDGECTY